jgi:hypothetical protein
MDVRQQTDKTNLMTMKEKTFKNLGQIVMTPEVLAATKISEGFADFVSSCLFRFQNCDWGPIDEISKALNDFAVSSNKKISANYDNPIMCKRLFIITDESRYQTIISFSNLMT